MEKTSTPQTFLWPVLGCGVGLRAEHYEYILHEKPRVAWFEAVTENFMDSGGRPLEILTRIRENYPVALHGVSLSIGSADPLNPVYLERLKRLADRIDPFVVSDHLCWSGVEGEQLHDLLPLPFTEEAVDYVAERIQRLQDFLGRKFLIENVSTYVTYKHSVMSEWQFLVETARRAGCGILLDLNNIYVNSKNHNFDPYEYLRQVPAELVGQFHLAGHTDMGEFLFDTHTGSITDPVWKLYEKSLELYGPVSTLIEWDAAIPEFPRLAEETAKAEKIYEKYSGGRKTPLVFSPKKYPAETAASLRKAVFEDQRRLKTLVRPGAEPDAASFLNPQGTATGRERMAVYAGGYVARIHESLGETYEAVKHILGEEAFFHLTEAYAAAHPSLSYNLSDAGKELASFLETPEWKEKFAFLSDLARLERLIAESFHAFSEKAFDPSSLAGLGEDDWNALRLSFQPSVKIFSSAWPVVDVWNARKTPLTEINIPLVDRPQCALVHRQEFQVQCRLISGFEYEFLSLLKSGRTLGEACERLGEMTSEDLPLMDWFTFWSSAGLLTAGSPAVLHS